VSYRINNRFSLGLGIIYATGNMKLRQALPVEDYGGRNGEAVLNGSAGGWGFNAGLSVKASEKLSFGLTYRSGVNLILKNGDADFTVPSSLTSAFPNTKFKAVLPLPEVLSLGAAYQATTKLALQADLEYTGWKAYDTLKFDYTQNTPELEDTHLPRRYHNTLTIRAGVHYQFSRQIAGMIGGAYDPTPVSDGYVSPDLPDANRLTGTLGLTYSPLKSLKIMLAAEFLTSGKRTATYLPGNFSGAYQSKAFTGGLGIVYQF
jgi:long-chain fatty acid transport protein